MTHEIFIEQIKSYYGKYPEGSNVEVYVMHYLNHDIDPERLDRLFAYICHSHPVNYGPPDIAAMESAIIWALKNTKNAIDVHKQSITDIRDMWPVITDEEHEAGKKLLDDAGGLKGLMADRIGSKSIEALEEAERRDPYTD